VGRSRGRRPDQGIFLVASQDETRASVPSKALYAVPQAGAKRLGQARQPVGKGGAVSWSEWLRGYDLHGGHSRFDWASTGLRMGIGIEENKKAHEGQRGGTFKSMCAVQIHQLKTPTPKTEARDDFRDSRTAWSKGEGFDLVRTQMRTRPKLGTEPRCFDRPKKQNGGAGRRAAPAPPAGTSREHLARRRRAGGACSPRIDRRSTQAPSCIPLARLAVPGRGLAEETRAARLPVFTHVVDSGRPTLRTLPVAVRARSRPRR